MAKEKLIINVDGQDIELKGNELDAFIEQKKADQEQASFIEAEQTAKREARESAIKKLAEVAGLSKDELDAIL
jgi:hypothetical protein